MDNKVMYSLSYGLFVLSARQGDKDNGCITNTAIQVTTTPNRIVCAVNKSNYTHDMVLETGRFTLSIEPVDLKAEFEDAVYTYREFFRKDGLELHYRDVDLSQTQVADAFRISSYTLSRMFKTQIGVGFTEYVNFKRLEYAKELLLTTGYSVHEIAFLAGYANDNYFSRIFKANVGMSPTAFREK